MSRAYGPHRPEDVPKTQILWKRTEVRVEEIEIPFPAALAEQRRQINNAAWFAGLGGASPCP